MEGKQPRSSSIRGRQCRGIVIGSGRHMAVSGWRIGTGRTHRSAVDRKSARLAGGIRCIGFGGCFASLPCAPAKLPGNRSVGRRARYHAVVGESKAAAVRFNRKCGLESRCGSIFVVCVSLVHRFAWARCPRCLEGRVGRPRCGSCHHAVDSFRSTGSPSRQTLQLCIVVRVTEGTNTRI